MLDFAEGLLIVGGDFSLSPNPSLDTSSGKSNLSKVALKHFSRSLDRLRLVECWTITHSSDRDYTYYSPMHNSYSRLELFMVSQGYLEDLLEVRIPPERSQTTCQCC